MKTILALAATSLIALATPVFAQDAGAPGATGTGGGLTGSNPGTDGRFDRNYGYPDERGGYLNEGRAAAPDYGYDRPIDGAPSGAWRSRSETPGVGADLVGPGSDMDNPTGGRDVSR